jgi:hypothetical protein
MFEDSTNDELDDREFTVRLVQRQLDGDVPLDEVRAWPDEQLLAAADAWFELDTSDQPIYGEAAADDDRGEADADDAANDDDDRADVDGEDAGDEPERLTFAGVRDEVRQIGVRKARRMQGTIKGILELSNKNAAQVRELMKMPGFSTKLGNPFGAGLASQMKVIQDTYGPLMRGIDASILGPSTVISDAMKALDVGKLGGLGDTSRIGAGLGKALSDRLAGEGLTQAMPELGRPTPTYVSLPPFVRPEVRLLGEVSDRLADVSETLEKMHDDEAKDAQTRLEVMVEQSRLLKAQGDALTELVNDAKGQRWSRRMVLITSVIAAVASVGALLYAAGVLRSGATAASAEPSIPPAAATAPANPPASPTPAPTATPTRTRRR